MKIKNVEIGGYIQSKKDSKQLIAGHCYQVAEKDVSDKGVRLFSVDDSFDDSLWFFVSDFRKPRPQPKLKQLDQSVFNHPYVDDRFNYVALNADGQSIFFEQKPSVSVNLDIWVATGGSILPMLKGYDASDWQNSLIERDTAKELLEVDLSSGLTGSDLTRSILSKQFMQACLVSDSSDKAALQGDDLQLIRMYNETDGKFISMRDPWYGCHHKYAVAVDNNRKPLAATDVGL